MSVIIYSKHSYMQGRAKQSNYSAIEVIDADAFWNEEETAIFEDESGEFYL